MKKLLLLLCLFAIAINTDAQSGKKTLKKHESKPILFWFRPVIDVPILTLEGEGENVNKWFDTEGYLSDGTPIQVMIEGKTLKHLFKLPVKQDITQNLKFTGYMYTGKSMKSYSKMSKRKIKWSSKFYAKQKPILIRERRTEKYELWGESPVKVEGKLINGKFLPASNDQSSVVTESLDINGKPNIEH